MAKLSLDEARFERGLTQAERRYLTFGRNLKANPVEIVPQKSARESAQVFEEVARQYEQHIGNLDNDRINRALGQGPGAIGLLSGKSAAASASVFEQAAEAPATGFAAGFKKIFARKFSFGDALKDSLKAFGVAGVGAVVTSVTDFFSRRADRARGQADVSQSSLEGLRATLATLGGINRQVQLGQQEWTALGRDIAETQKTLDALTSGSFAEGMNLANPFWKQQVDAVSAELDELKKKQDAVGQRNTLISRELAFQNTLYHLELAAIKEQNAMQADGKSQGERALAAAYAIQQKLDAAKAANRPVEEQRAITLELERQKGIAQNLSDEESYRFQQQKQELDAVRDMNALEKAQASALTKARNELGQLRIQRSTAILNNRPKEEINAITIAITRQEGATQALMRQLKEDRTLILKTLASQAAAGRKFSNGAERPLNETERLAQRAVREREASTRAVIEGRPNDARDNMRRAQRDEASVAGRLAKGSSLIDTDKNAGELTAIHSEIVNSNTLLSSIDAALRPLKIEGN